MNIESEIFKRTKMNPGKLIDYGFVKQHARYIFSKNFMNDNFKAYITVNSQGVVSGTIYDLNMGDEYVNFRIKNQNGAFVNQVREEYTNILKDIAARCFDQKFFIFDQANRITDHIVKMFQSEPEFLWTKYPGYGIFRNPTSRKWYAVIMNIDKSRIDSKESGEVEVINLKLKASMISDLLMQTGFYPAYHMNKKNWITIILDDTISDEVILNYIQDSHALTE